MREQQRSYQHSWKYPQYIVAIPGDFRCRSSAPKFRPFKPFLMGSRGCQPNSGKIGVYMKDELVLITGAGGFIGGNLVADFRKQRYKKIRAVDIKPLDEWYQR